MTAKSYHVSSTLKEIPVSAQNTTLNNRGQIYEWVTRHISRADLYKEYGISQLVSTTQALLDLTRLGHLTITHTRHKYKSAYSPSLRGFLRVTLTRSAGSLSFTSRNRKEVYTNLKTSLYPNYPPSDRQFLAHMSGEINRRLTENMSVVEVVSQLESAGYLTIEELQHAPKRR